MNTHRVTLTAFGTTGVLLAASLTMLALVSALVTFDAWPTRDRGLSPAEIAVEHPHAARVVRAVRQTGATSGAAATGGAGGGSAGGDRVAGLPGGNPGGGFGGGGGNPGNPNGGGPSNDPSPTPHVPPSPPGEDPTPGDPGGPPVTGDGGTLVDQVTDTACGAVSGVGATGSVCKSSPDSYEDPYGGGGVELDTPAPVDVNVPVDVPALP